MKPGGEKSNCVSDHSDFFFNVLMIFQFCPRHIGAFLGEHSPVAAKCITCNFGIIQMFQAYVA